MNKLTVLFLMLLFFSCTREKTSSKEKYPTICMSSDSLSTLKKDYYEQGYKRAVIDFMLLLEDETNKGTKTYGEMRDSLLLNTDDFK